MQLQLDWINVRGYGGHIESAKQVAALDMTRVPTTDELIGLMTLGSRIGLDEVKRHPHGHVFDESPVEVAPRDADCDALLELADPLMIADLDAVYDDYAAPSIPGNSSGLSLVCRRANNFMNSVGQNLSTLSGGRPVNPLFIHPERMAQSGFAEGETIVIASASGSLVAPLKADDSLRLDTVAIFHGFGDPSAGDGSGNAVTRLIGMDEFDPISGIPRMSAIPVTIRRCATLGPRAREEGPPQSARPRTRRGDDGATQESHP